MNTTHINPNDPAFDIPDWLKRTDKPKRYTLMRDPDRHPGSYLTIPKWVHDKLAADRAIACQREENKKKRDERAAKKKEKADNRQRVFAAIKRGHDTIGKLRKQTGYEDGVIRSAIRALVKTKAVVKASARTYKAK